MLMTDKLTEVDALMRSLRQEYPQEIAAFLNFMQKAEAGPALDLRVKELINVALSVAAQCEWCIALHVKHAVTAGARREEIVSAGFMAVIMHGGPALMYLNPLLQAVEEFAPAA
jgi:AhpD family alkylhydroperoxidase